MNKDFKEVLETMYDLGYSHGLCMAKKEQELEQLQKEVEALNEQQ